MSVYGVWYGICVKGNVCGEVVAFQAVASLWEVMAARAAVLRSDNSLAARNLAGSDITSPNGDTTCAKRTQLKNNNYEYNEQQNRKPTEVRYQPL